MGSRKKIIRTIMEEYDVSSEQAEVVIVHGNSVVCACPGSGKTRTVGTRLAHLVQDWPNRRSGIAVISFTNVAAMEIADRLEQLGLPRILPPPHFLGTINSFVDRFVFMPHAHRVMRPNLPPKKPQLVLDFNQDWINTTFTPQGLKQKRILISKFHFRMDGSLRYQSSSIPRLLSSVDMDAAKDAKLKMARAGYATHTDAMYWAMKVLETCPDIAAAIGTRFSEIIVDEFQDTSLTQLEILQRLARASSCMLMLVGDPHQSIFGFNEASPDALLCPETVFCGEWNHLGLTSNYRSSHLICRVTHHFCGRSVPDQARGKYKDYHMQPTVFCYPDKQVQSVLDKFAMILENSGILVEQGTVVTRTNATVRRLLGMKETRKFPSSVRHVTRMLMRSAYYRDTCQWAKAGEETEYALLRLVFDEVSYGPHRAVLRDLSFREWKRGCFNLLDRLPKTDRPLCEWLTEAREAFAQFRVKCPWEYRKPLQLGRLFPNLSTPARNIQVTQFVESSKSSVPFDIKTIHQAKGETHAATMLVASPQLRKNSPSDVYDWFQPVQSNGLRPEEVRRVFVSLTRPQKIAVVAVPQSAWDEVHEEFQARGFKTCD